MNISTFLQSIITIIFIYLLLALIDSELQENVAAILQLRAKQLRKSIQQLLGETDNFHALTDSIYQHPNISTLYQNTYTLIPLISKSVILIIILYLINASTFLPLAKCILFIFALFFVSAVWPKLKFWPKLISGDLVGPSYITDSTIFAKTALEVIKNELTKTDSNVNKKAANEETIIIQANAEATKNGVTDQSEIDNIIKRMMLKAGLTTNDKNLLLTENIYRYFTDIDLTIKDSAISALAAINKTENWVALEGKLRIQYDEVQKRSSGEYKRNAKSLSFAVGLVIAAISNADIFNIVNILNKTNSDFSSQLIRKIEESNVIKDSLKTQASSPKAESTNPREFTPNEKEAITGIVQDISVLPLGWSYEVDLKKYQASQDLKAQAKILEILNKPENKKSCAPIPPNTNVESSTTCFDMVAADLTQDKILIVALDSDFKDKFIRLEEAVKCQLTCPVATINLAG